MTADGALWLFASVGWGATFLILALRSPWLDKLAHYLTGRHQPAREQQECPRHLKVIGPPRPLPRGDCGLKDWRGGDGAA